MGRRVRKTVFTYSSGAWTETSTKLFVYDGWNLIQELDGTGALQKSYIWGLDLSQTIQGAGGIGGLLTSTDGTDTYHYFYDGNGNVGQVLDASDGSVAAHYEYDPFGKSVFSYGILADENPFRFSTKYLDAETDLYYYGYRYYSPELGRWTRRDPIGEQGRINLYNIANNNLINFIDIYGLQEYSDIEIKGEKGPIWTENNNFNVTWSQDISLKILSLSNLGEELVNRLKQMEKKGGELKYLNKYTMEEYGIVISSMPTTDDLVILIPEGKSNLYAAQSLAHEIIHQVHNYYRDKYKYHPQLTETGRYIIAKEYKLATECVAHKAEVQVYRELKKIFPSLRQSQKLIDAYGNDTLCEYIKDEYSKLSEPYRIPKNTCCPSECKRDKPLNFKLPEICHKKYLIKR